MDSPPNRLPQPDLQELQTKLAELLVNGAVYKKYQYYGTPAVNFFVEVRTMGKDRVGLLPKQVRMYCGDEYCQYVTIWEAHSAEVYFGTDDFHYARYTCRNCGRNQQHYWFRWIGRENDKCLFEKVGQFPALSIEPSKDLAKALGKADTELYKKALINGNFSFGLGALSYFRRVIENKVNMLLDMIGEAARLANFAPEELTRIDEIKGSHHLDTKIEYASKILPPNLRPGGHNPLNKLYSIASAGLHGKSDEECLDDFTSARFEFEYLFKNLTVSNEEAKEYLERVSSPPKKIG